MLDLALDANDNLTVDAAQQLKLVADASEVGQAVKIALRAWQREYFLDQAFGVDYLGRIFTKPFKPAQAEREIRRVLREVEGVRSVTSITVNSDWETRTLGCSLELITTFGTEQITV